MSKYQSQVKIGRDSSKTKILLFGLGNFGAYCDEILKIRDTSDLYIVDTAKTVYELFEKTGFQLPDLNILFLNLENQDHWELIRYFSDRNIPSVVVTEFISKTDYKTILQFKVIDCLHIHHDSLNTYLGECIYRFIDNPHRSVALVEDDPVSRKLLKRMLEMLSLKVTEFADPLEFEEKMTESPYSLILMDYILPGKTGFDCIQSVRRKFDRNKTAIIGLSAYDSPSVGADFFRFGANDYIEKPIRRDQLYTRVNQQLDRLRIIENLEMLNQQKSKLLGVVAHDLRTPLTIINGVSDLMANQIIGNLNSQQKNMMETIRRTGKVMVGMVDDLLDISVIESGQLSIHSKPTEMNSYLKSQLESLELLGKEKEITLIHQIENLEPVHLNVDPQKFTQVLFNLVSNAYKYSPKGTNVHLRTKSENGCWILELRDEGIGIKKEELGNLFKPFGKTSNAPTGKEKSVGLGLMIVKKIVEAHKGKISVESEIGKGTVFYVEIPISAA